MKIINNTHPEETPINGDSITITYDNGSTETKYYWTPTTSPESPIPEKEYTFLEFMYGGRLTEKEVITLYSKEREITNDGLMVLISIDGLRMANGILISHPNTKKAIDIWVAVGIITQERANEILTV